MHFNTLIINALNMLAILLQISDKAVPLRQKNKKTENYDETKINK
jgi:hypothetical protein